MDSAKPPLDDKLFSEAYEELRRLARRLNNPASLTWNATALVNEVYVRLAGSSGLQTESKLHFKHTIVRAMRHVLIDAARKKAAARRGGGSSPVQHVPLDAAPEPVSNLDPEELVNVHLALEQLEQQDEAKARIFEYQFFGGLEVSEIAELTGCSEKTVQRSLRFARAYLATLLREGTTV